MKSTILTASLAAALLATSALAASENEYQCSYVNGDDPSVTSTTLTVSDSYAVVDQDGAKSKGAHNRGYSPRTGDENYVEYTGFEGMSEDGYQVEVLVAKQLLKGANKGTLKIRARGEGYFNTVYNCTLQ